MGFFCIIATILRAYYSLLSLDTLSIALGWASRETFVGTVVACAPGIKPLFSSTKWFRSTSAGSRDRRSGDKLSRWISLPFSKKQSHKGINGDGTIMISRSVDVYRSQRPSVDAVDPYGVEMGKWKKQHVTSDSYASDERVIMDDEQALKPKNSHKSVQCNVREFFMGEATRSKDHV